MSRVAILGAGAWGTALAQTVARGGNSVTLWGRDASRMAVISGTRENAAYLPGVRLDDAIEPGADIGEAVRGADAILVVTPAQTLAAILPAIADYATANVPLVLCAKGIERGTGRLMSDIATELCPANPVAALSGPSFAADVARGLPTAVTIAAQDNDLAGELASMLSSGTFRCYSSDDLVGVELGGALKNVLAIAAGAAHGAGLGASAQAALVTRGFVELRRLAETFGARAETLMGLSGLGDLMLTCGSEKSRNFAYGAAIGRGDLLEGLPLAEGAFTAQIAASIARDRGVTAPIIEAVDHILEGRMTIAKAVTALMTRPLRNETD
jgi:glycerol-3-phosphate dehydrogenase (NAD(P)+)